jgi:hypothetical protein
LSLKCTAKKYSKILGIMNMSFYILLELAKGEKFRLKYDGQPDPSVRNK